MQVPAGTLQKGPRSTNAGSGDNLGLKRSRVERVAILDRLFGLGSRRRWSGEAPPIESEGHEDA